MSFMIIVYYWCFIVKFIEQITEHLDYQKEMEL